MLKIGKAVGKGLLKATSADVDFGRLDGEGVVDFAGRRYLIDYGAYAVLYARDKEWSGRSGRELFTLEPDLDVVPRPLWLLDLLAGVTSARDLGPDEVRGARCRHLAATADLGKASSLMPGGLTPPSVRRFEDLLALPVEVWLDESNLSRVRFVAKDHVETLELWDHGVSLDHLDWTRLPTFRTPPEGSGAGGRPSGRSRRSRGRAPSDRG
jgi:hypothetical protein